MLFLALTHLPSPYLLDLPVQIPLHVDQEAILER